MSDKDIPMADDVRALEPKALALAIRVWLTMDFNLHSIGRMLVEDAAARLDNWPGYDKPSPVELIPNAAADHATINLQAKTIGDLNKSVEVLKEANANYSEALAAIRALGCPASRSTVNWVRDLIHDDKAVAALKADHELVCRHRDEARKARDDASNANSVLRRDYERSQSALAEANEEVTLLTDLNAGLRREISTIGRHKDGDCWYWSEDGASENMLESIANDCPVVIRAQVLRDLLGGSNSDIVVTREEGEKNDATYASYAVRYPNANNRSGHGNSYYAIRVVKMIDAGSPKAYKPLWFDEIERRLLRAAHPSQSEQSPEVTGETPPQLIARTERLCMKLATEMCVTPPAIGIAWRNGTGDQPKVWRIACGLMQEALDVDMWRIAADWDEIPF